MRKILGPLLLGLGGFLLTTALMVALWVPGQVKKTPLDVDSITTLLGDASYLGSDRAPVKATSHTVIDGDASTGAVAVFQSFTCLMWNKDGKAPNCVSAEAADTRLINAGADNFATDRVTAEAVSDQEKFLGANASPHEGLINKFPFGVEKKTYPFWDGILNRAVDAAFVGEEKLDGLSTYKFNINVQDQPAEVASGVQGKYSDDKTMWIDPVTGSIIKQAEKQVRTLADGGSALDMNLAFTDEQVASNVSDAKANGNKLGLVGKMPWIAGLLGLASLALGALLVLGKGDDDDVAPAAAAPAAGTTAAGATTVGTTLPRGTDPALDTTVRRPGAPGAGATAPDATRPLPRLEQGGPLFGSRDPKDPESGSGINLTKG
ncbi:DUF3068 domain-containing protein [Nostocoides vanveenii]|uniref:DUF3068 domain-containing protein n=1 Tax=Nostocoides vanveenii TaxID=330835 RepID=A0ABP4WQ69_9MICO